MSAVKPSRLLYMLSSVRNLPIVPSPFFSLSIMVVTESATCLIWKTMMVTEMNFRKLNAPHLVEKVAEGKKYENGEEVRVAA